MIDFKNARYIKLRPVKASNFDKMVSPLFVAGEEIIEAYQGVRDGIVFTNKRVIVINIQGVTGKKKDFTSLPYHKVQSYSIETAGLFDVDCELILWFAELGAVYFELSSGTKVVELCRKISEHILS